MFGMKPKAALALSELSDAALAEKLAAATRRGKWKEFLAITLLLAAAIGGAVAGGFIGAAIGGHLGAVIVGALGLGAVVNVADDVPDAWVSKSTPQVKACVRETSRRSAARAAAEELTTKPLAPGAAEAFAASLSEGAKDKIAVNKALRFKTRQWLTCR